jgi:FkbM family methyltransferase
MLQTLKRAVKHTLLAWSGRFSHLRVAVKANKHWYGNVYGGFYACPDFLNSGSIIYSVGIGEDASFDEAVIARHGCQVHGFDPTPKVIAWVKSHFDLPASFVFHPYGLGAQTEIATFYLPKITDHVSGSFVAQTNVDQGRAITVQLKSLADIARELGHDRIDVFKMDIEGGEYAALDSILASPVWIGQLLLEFHERFFDDGRARTEAVIEKLRRQGFEIFAMSSNFEEISFINTHLLGKAQ